MIYEYRTYTMVPGGVARFLELFEKIALPIRSAYTGKLVGFWTDRSGDRRTVHHLWRYESLDTRASDRAALGNDKAWLEDFVKPITPLLRTQRNAFLHLRHGDVSALTSESLRMIWLLCQPFTTGAVLKEAGGRLERSVVWSCEVPDPNRLLVLTNSPPSADADSLRSMIESSEQSSSAILEVRSVELASVSFSPMH